MPKLLSSPDVMRKAYTRLWDGRRELTPLAGGMFAAFLLAGLARALFPGAYVFDPTDQAWLLLPEAMVLGPLTALLHHRLLGTGEAFGWSAENRLLKFAKAAAYGYVLIILFKLGLFVGMQVIPGLVGYVAGPTAGALYPLIAGCGVVLFLLVYTRMILVYAVLAGEEREPLIQALLLSKGKTRQIVSRLLLLVAPVLIPWIGATAYGGDWLNPALGPGIRILPILTRPVLLTAGVLLLSSGLCVIYEALIAAEDCGETDQDV